MSYILDALNKSEQERERKQTPGLKSLRGEPPPNRFQLRHFLYLLALLAIFNSIVIFFYLGNQSQPTVGIRPHGETPLDRSLVTGNAARDETPSTSLITSADQSAGFTTQVTSDNTVTVNGLREQVLSQLPDIKITAHIFSSDPALRMVNINGLSRREGDFVRDGLMLVEITKSGVVMNFSGDAYVINLVDDWQNNP